MSALVAKLERLERRVAELERELGVEPVEVPPFLVQPLIDRLGTAGALADLVGVSRRTIERWKAEGLTEAQADRFAVLAGYNPSEVWPAWFD